MSASPQLFIDSREIDKDKKLIEMLQKTYPTSTMTMQAGDFMIPKQEGFILIERMTATDFLGKIRSDRLRPQLEGMKQLTDDYYVIVENWWTVRKFTKWNIKSAIALLMSVVEKHRVIKCDNRLETFHAIQYFFDKYAVGRKVSQSEVRFKPKDMTTDQQAVYALAGLEGIGKATAEKLLRHFGSLQSISNAEIADLELVVNKKLASRIYDVCRVTI